METINIISHNYCNGDANFINNRFSTGTEPTQEQVDKLYPGYGLSQGCDECTEDFSITSVQRTPVRIQLWLTESFAQMLSGTITCNGDDACIDYIPSAIEQFFSVLRLLQSSDDPVIREALSRCNLSLWAKLFDLRINSFDHEDESAPGFIDHFLTWDESLRTERDYEIHLAYFI